jgi:hypothetical protein
MERLDYVVIPVEVWDKFRSIYSGGPKIEIFVNNGIPDLEPIPIEIVCDRI